MKKCEIKIKIDLVAKTLFDVDDDLNELTEEDKKVFLESVQNEVIDALEDFFGVGEEGDTTKLKCNIVLKPYRKSEKLIDYNFTIDSKKDNIEDFRK